MLKDAVTEIKTNFTKDLAQSQQQATALATKMEQLKGAIYATDLVLAELDKPQEIKLPLEEVTAEKPAKK